MRWPAMLGLLVLLGLSCLQRDLVDALIISLVLRSVFELFDARPVERRHPRP